MLCHHLAYATVEERPVVEATTAPEQVVRAYFDLWNERDYAAIPDVVSASYVLYDPIVPADIFGGRRARSTGPTAWSSTSGPVPGRFRTSTSPSTRWSHGSESS